MVNKEVHFFDSEENFKKGIEWYEHFFKHSTNEKAVGEKTPEYLYNEKVPQRMHTILPNVKLIFVLRNPVQRAYSHYWHNVRSGKELLPFHKALEKEDERRSNQEYKNLYSYKERGKYINQIKQYEEFFPQSQMLFVLAEDLKANTRTILSSILDFLDVETDVTFEDLSKKHVGGVPRSRLLAKLAGYETMKKVRFLRNLIIGINNKKGSVPQMNKETKKYLTTYFKPYNDKLKNFTGLDLSRWEDTEEDEK
jgi:hypothetical protein